MNNNFMDSFNLGEQERQTKEMYEFRKAYCQANGIEFVETINESSNFSIPSWLKHLVGGMFTGIIILSLIYLWFLIS